MQNLKKAYWELIKPTIQTVVKNTLFVTAFSTVGAVVIAMMDAGSTELVSLLF